MKDLLDSAYLYQASTPCLLRNPHVRVFLLVTIFSDRIAARPHKKLRGTELEVPTPCSSRINYAPTPISSDREITYISAERKTGTDCEREYRILLRYWVVESKIPDIERIRQYQTRVYGRPWDVLS
jgi:hypothetical protein